MRKARPGSSSSIPLYFPEGATGAVEVATKIFWAFGYNQVESFLTTFDPKHVEIDPKATIRRPSGARTRFTQDDINAILERVARNADGTYRVVAGRLIPGKILGGFLYDGTRPDDPNDVVPHEHRRELRALRVFGAWTNLTDLKAANTLDALVTENGRSIVKHYLQDVGSTFGMCNDIHEWDLSWEHFYQGDTTRRRLFSFGFALSPWQTVDYVEYPSIGKFEGDRFDPRKWRPQTPTTAYMELRDDDAFWAARRVAAFTDELIRAAVHTGEYSDPAAEKYLADVLIKRRDKIKSIYLTAVNPIVSPRLDANSRLTFENAAFAAGVASGAGHLPRLLVSLRQRDGRDSGHFRNAEPDDDDRGAARPADGVWQFRRGGHLRRQRGTPDVAAADPHVLSAGKAEAGRSWGSNGCPRPPQPVGRRKIRRSPWCTTGSTCGARTGPTRGGHPS